MKLNYWIVIILSCTSVLSCSKKYTTRPQIELKAISSNILHPGDSIQFTFETRDREGDMDLLYIQKKTKNCSASDGSIAPPLPTFQATKDQKATIYVKFGYQSIGALTQLPIPQCVGQNDTCVFRFALSDRAGNVSDTLSTPTIILFR